MAYRERATYPQQVYGFAATYVVDGDILVYTSLKDMDRYTTVEDGDFVAVYKFDGLRRVKRGGLVLIEDRE